MFLRIMQTLVLEQYTHVPCLIIMQALAQFPGPVQHIVMGYLMVCISQRISVFCEFSGRLCSEKGTGRKSLSQILGERDE